MLADLGISDVNITSISGNATVITTTHRIIHEDGSVEHFQLRMDQESAGTQRFFARIGGWLQALDQGALLLVDSLASFSPRKGEDVRKCHLRGRFGALPFIGGEDGDEIQERV